MFRYFKIATVCLLFLIFALPASAEFYQYVDGNGITHFTDKLSTVPIKYQSQLESRRKITPPPDGEFDSLTDASETGDPDYFIDGDDTDVSKLAAKRNILQDEKQALNEKFEMLIAEKQSLEKSRSAMKTEDDITRYNIRIQEMNEKIRTYKAEEKRFISEIARYNELIETLITE